MSCYLSFILTGEDDLIFDAAWTDPESLAKLAQLIYLMQNSDLIMQNILDMDTDNKEDIEILARELNKINDHPAIMPLEVYNEKGN
jgi:hypothetical protein